MAAIELMPIDQGGGLFLVNLPNGITTLREWGIDKNLSLLLGKKKQREGHAEYP